MKFFVAERLIDGKWEPWYMRETTFRRALKLSCQDASKDTFRLRRVETQEECCAIQRAGTTLFSDKD